MKLAVMFLVFIQATWLYAIPAGYSCTATLEAEPNAASFLTYTKTFDLKATRLEGNSGSSADRFIGTLNFKFPDFEMSNSPVYADSGTNEETGNSVDDERIPSAEELRNSLYPAVRKVRVELVQYAPSPDALGNEPRRLESEKFLISVEVENPADKKTYASEAYLVRAGAFQSSAETEATLRLPNNNVMRAKLECVGLPLR
jgi:hypothetical protein